MLIDCHVHAYTKGKIKKLLSSMKRNGIDKAIILHWPNIPGGKKAPSLKEVLRNLKNYQNLFLVGSIRVTKNPKFNENLKELEKYLSEKKIVGIKLYPGYEYFYPHDMKCDPIYKLCLRYDVPVIFHSGDVIGTFKKAKIKFANPIFIDDVAVKFPGLKIIVAHLGWPCWTKEVTQLLHKNKNVFTDFSGCVVPPEGFGKAYNEKLREEILELVYFCGSPRKLLFGTDFAVFSQEIYIHFLEGFNFPKADMEFIKYKNAEKLFGI